MKPRVLLLSQEVHPIPPVKGAAVEQWIDAVARGMKRFEPHVVGPVHPERPDEEVSDGVHHRRIRVGALYHRLFRKITRWDPHSYIERVIDHARSFSPAIVHLHNAPHFVPALRRGFPGAKLILHLHNQKALPAGLEFDCLAACSDFIRRWYEQQRLRCASYATIRNGVDCRRFQPKWNLPDRGAAARRRHGIPADKRVILLVGRISPEKGTDLAVDAFRLLDPERYHLVLVGEWPEGDPLRNDRVVFARALKEKLRGLAATCIDTVAPAAMPEIYPVGDLLVIPSRFEAFSMVAIEGMAAGVPVLALRRGGMVEYMVDGENARLLDADAAPGAFAAAIEELVADPEPAERLARNAREMVERRFGWEKVVDETEALYRNLLEKK